MAFHYTYVLRCRDGEWYIGLTDDLSRRMEQHAVGRVPTTAHRMPVELIYFEACRSREGAAERERQLKTGFGRGYLKRRLTHER